MGEKLKQKLKEEGRSLRWFHRKYIDKFGLTYNAMSLQINGYAVICENLSKTIRDYLGRRDQ